MKILITSIIILSCQFLQAQVKIENVNFKLHKNEICVSYDLLGEGMYTVELYYTKDNGKKWHGPLRNISGDVEEVKEGKGKTIKYDFGKNDDWLVGDNIKFKVQLLPGGTFIDPRDKTKYKWVKIGEQIWMAENLKAKKYSDGTPIPLVHGYQRNHSTIARFQYKNKRSYADKYGQLYTWAAATKGKSSDNNPSGIQGVCPDGWHIPSKDEWDQLADFINKDKGPYIDLGEINLYVGKHLKSQAGWVDDYSWLDEFKGTDDYGFKGLPGGHHMSKKREFTGEGKYAYWWSTTLDDYRDNAIYAMLNFNSIDFFSHYYGDTRHAMSVRCVKDR